MSWVDGLCSSAHAKWEQSYLEAFILANFFYNLYYCFFYFTFSFILMLQDGYWHTGYTMSILGCLPWLSGVMVTFGFQKSISVYFCLSSPHLLSYIPWFSHQLARPCVLLLWNRLPGYRRGECADINTAGAPRWIVEGWGGHGCSRLSGTALGSPTYPRPNAHAPTHAKRKHPPQKKTKQKRGAQIRWVMNCGGSTCWAHSIPHTLAWVFLLMAQLFHCES